MPHTLRIQRLDHSELPDCLRLAADRGWPPEEAKWGLLFDVGEVYGCRDDAGDLVATAILTRYGGLATISMVLVATRYGRQGLGSRMMRHVLAAAGDVRVSLHATSFGQPLYERLGFEAVQLMVNHGGTYRPTGDPPVSRVAVAADLPRIVALDAGDGGADRSAMYQRFFPFAEQVRITPDGSGFAAAWRTVGETVIGPVVAATRDEARGLINDVAAAVTGRVRLDLYDPDLMEWARARGLESGFTNQLMVRGGPLPGRRERTFAPVMLAL